MTLSECFFFFLGETMGTCTLHVHVDKFGFNSKDTTTKLTEHNYLLCVMPDDFTHQLGAYPGGS